MAVGPILKLFPPQQLWLDLKLASNNVKLVIRAGQDREKFSLRGAKTQVFTAWLLQWDCFKTSVNNSVHIDMRFLSAHIHCVVYQPGALRLTSHGACNHQLLRELMLPYNHCNVPRGTENCFPTCSWITSFFPHTASSPGAGPTCDSWEQPPETGATLTGFMLV